MASSTLRLATAALLAAGTLAAATATPAAAAGRSEATGNCPVAQLSKVWHGGEQDSWSVERCGDIQDWYGHLFYPGYMLTPGHHRYYNENVVVLQLRLRDLGYAPLGVDGVYGPQTAGTVTRYQSNHGLIVDGAVGEQTWTELFGLGAA